MLKQLLIATTNIHKVAEIQDIAMVAGYSAICWHSLAEFPTYIPPEETGLTFAENAIIKARAAQAFTGMISLADDSGLTVDALEGAPGVHSARFAADHDHAANNRKLLTLLAELPRERRHAAFCAVVAVAYPDGRLELAEGRCEGEIAFSAAGIDGFGYDPLFYLPEFGCTMAELAEKDKNKISHRGRAIRAILPNL
ncbi:MAG: RdgB/HAM1 family non-canonical purine NTP pyrophosphatase [Clostridiales bacterium]